MFFRCSPTSKLVLQSQIKLMGMRMCFLIEIRSDHQYLFPRWEQAAGATVSFTVPDNWTSGRIWGRTECDFTTVQGPTSCATGGCNGGLVCDASTGTVRPVFSINGSAVDLENSFSDRFFPWLCHQGVPPATVAEWTLSGAQDLDYYDVSVVDGFNVPVAVTVSDTSCSTASCPADLNSDCGISFTPTWT